jgi:hypothetical protein
MLDISLSVWNAYGRKNVAGYFWNATENRQDTQYQWSALPVPRFTPMQRSADARTIC